MEIFILTCLAILAALAAFYLLVFPTLLLLGMVVSAGIGVVSGYYGLGKRSNL